MAEAGGRSLSVIHFICAELPPNRKLGIFTLKARALNVATELAATMT